MESFDNRFTSQVDLLSDNDQHVIKIVIRNVDIYSRDVFHEILPVNILMFKYNISKTYKCVYCNEVETLRHLFFEYTFNSQLL